LYNYFYPADINTCSRRYKCIPAARCTFVENGYTMDKKLIISNTIALDAAPEKVWAILTQPEWVKQYMFGCDLLTDWQIGGPFIFRSEYEGKQIDAVVGKLVEIVPHQKLVYTTFDPNSGYKDEPWNYLTVVYTLEEKNGGTVLTIEQGDFSGVENGEARYNDAYGQGGWSGVLDQIAGLLKK
jgi:uncharacterized protein YndB with AHSA1/START domain